MDEIGRRAHAEVLRTTLALLSRSLSLSRVEPESLTWDRPVFILRSASVERLRSLLRIVERRRPAPTLHIMSHARDEAVIAAMVDGDFVFHPYPTPGPYRLDAISSGTMERLRSAGFGTLLFLDGGTTGEGLDDVKRLMAGIDEPRAACFRGDDTFARPADWRLHLAADTAHRLLEQYRLRRTCSCWMDQW